MRRSIELSPKALADLDSIWKYTVENWGEARSEAYVRGINAALEMVAANPRMARDAGSVRPGLLKYYVGSHVIFFRLNDKRIVVSRILHARMDFPRHLLKPRAQPNVLATLVGLRANTSSGTKKSPASGPLALGA